MHMWMVPTWLMCGKHKAGEHGEIHKHRHNFVKGHSMTGRIAGNALEPRAMQARHDELAASLKNHQSPFAAPSVDYLPPEQRDFRVNVYDNLMLLRERCPACRERIDNEWRYI